MTSLTFALSRSLARTWRKGDEVIVTRLDHDANVSPWKLAALDAGAVVREIPFDPRTGALDLAALAAALSPRTRLVAVGCASNALGTINPVAEIGRRILVAWNGKREATRALHDAMPLLRSAESVHLITVGPERKGRTLLAEITEHMQRHGLRL